MTDTEKYFREYYSELIHIRPHLHPHYEQIYFLKWVARIFTDNNILSEEDLNGMRLAVIQKYGIPDPDFNDAEVKTVKLNQLKYFQESIGLSGPKYSVGELVKVVNYNGNEILFNGYHRVSVEIIAGQKTIRAKYLIL